MLKKTIFFVYVSLITIALFSQGVVYHTIYDYKFVDEEGKTATKKKTDETNVHFETDTFVENGKFKIVYTSDLKFSPYSKDVYFLGDATTNRAFYVNTSDKEYFEMELDDMIEQINLPAIYGDFYYLNLLFRKLGSKIVEKLFEKMIFGLEVKGTKIEVTQMPKKKILDEDCFGKVFTINCDDFFSGLMKGKAGINSGHHESKITLYYFVDSNVEKAFANTNLNKLWLVTADKEFDKANEKTLGFLGIPNQASLMIKLEGEKGFLQGEAKTTDIKFKELSDKTFQIPKDYKNVTKH